MAVLIMADWYAQFAAIKRSAGITSCVFTTHKPMVSAKIRKMSEKTAWVIKAVENVSFNVFS